MKRFIMMIMLTLNLGAINLQAKAHLASVQNTIAASEMQALFGNTYAHNIEVLQEGEMDETKGEFWFFFAPFLVSLGVWALSSLINREWSDYYVEFNKEF